jgi:autotransporter-associated beta strand protein
MKNRHPKNHFLAAITLAGFTLAAPALHAAPLTWQTTTGDWDLAATNWTGGVAWTQTSTSDADNEAIFAGTDGALDAYVVTIGATTMAAEKITFDNSGYLITGGTLALRPTTTTNGSITVAAGKTATINSAISYSNNAATTITSNTGSVLNLGGGASNAQYTFTGDGTVNMTSGSYQANTGSVNVATFNQTGGTFNPNQGSTVAYNIGNNAGRDVNYTISSAGILNSNANSNTITDARMVIGFTTGTNTATLTVKTGGTVNVGTGDRAGQLRLGGNSDSNGVLDVQGGALTVGTGKPLNKLYFYVAGADASRSATMTQSGGTVTAGGIQFGGSVGTYDPTSSASLSLSGGSLYVGADGITRGSAAGALPVAIKLLGGTLGTSAAWTSSLDMKLGTATIQAANSGGTAQNITLSGILSDDSGAGTLTKTGAGTLTLGGANEFTGATAVNQGTLVLANPDAASTSSSLTIADTAALSLTSTPSSVNTLTFTNTGTLNFNVAGGGTTLTVNTSNGVTNSGAAGSITINVTGTVPANGTYTLISYSGSLQGSGFSAYKLGTTPAGKSYSLVNAAGAVQLTVSDPSIWTGAQSSEWSTNIIPGSKNWSVSGSPADYISGAAVNFDDTATGYTVDISVADVTPASVIFNNNGATPYTLQGSKAIAGSTSLTKLGSQTLQISNPNTYTGPTTVTAGTLKLGAANVLPDGSSVTVDGTLDLNGFSETINGLSGTASGVIDNLAGGAVTLTVGNSNGSGEIFGAIKNTLGSLGIIKVGSGQLFLRGSASSFTGGVLVRNGTLNGGSSPNAIGTGGVTLGGSGSTGAAFIGGQDFSPNVNVTVNPPDSGTCVIGANGVGSGMVIGSITLNNADVTVDTVAGGTTAATTVKGGVTGTGNLLLNNRSTTAGNRIIFSAATVVNHTGTITSQGIGTTSNFIGADIGANVTGVIQNSTTALLVLDGINSYPGNTTVNAGILRINKAADPLNANLGNDASTVTIASGAQLNLQYTGTDIVDKLFFGPTQQPMGEYSSSSVPLGADITTASFLGGGKLYVNSSPGGSPYDTWATAKGLTGLPGSSTDPAKTADPDKDGKNNLQEFALDGNPLSGANDGKVVGKVATLLSLDKVLTLTLPVRDGASFGDDGGDQLAGPIDGIYYRIEGGTNLVTFAGTITEVTGTDADNIQAGLPTPLSTGWTYRTFRTAGTVPTVPKDFMRAKISETP